MNGRRKAIAIVAVVALLGSGAFLLGTALTQAAGKAQENVVGQKDTARWTETTLAAATSEAQKKVLAGGKVVTVTGEVVEVSCYLQLGKRGKAHVECATQCIENGQPIGLLDAEGNLYMLFVEEHDPRRDGDLDLADVFIPMLAETATVTGMMTEMKGYRALFIQGEEAEDMLYQREKGDGGQ